MDNFIKFLRAIVRPFTALTIVIAVVGLAVYLAINYADADMAKTIVTLLTTAWAIILGFYFGERSQKSK
jgi:steroid 5-alpha reductase family enzyme